ncbi:MAG: alcohol dehydrogenase catalytic domain-containing protein, partial [Myxococcales bacterium]|nr:alcohol dehydrogenase catalytic domain-containing protein [Myxococcales bacterium]
MVSVEDLQPGQRVVITAFGETPMDAVEDLLEVLEQPVPDTSQLGSRDLLIAVKSAAVGWVDLLMTSGQYQHMPSPPYSPGLEYAGVVVWAGAEVESEHVAIGDAVLADGFLTGPRSKGAYQGYGGFASY